MLLAHTKSIYAFFITAVAVLMVGHVILSSHKLWLLSFNIAISNGDLATQVSWVIHSSKLVASCNTHKHMLYIFDGWQSR